MSAENQKQNGSSTEKGNEYQAPVIEEVVTPDGLNREVAYAGVVAISQQSN